MRAFTGGSGAPGSAIIEVTASSSCSIKLTLAIRVTQLLSCKEAGTAAFPGSQALQSPELKLLDCALGASQFSGDFADTLLLGEAHPDHPPLICWKPLDKLEEPRALPNFNFDFRKADFGSEVETQGDCVLFRRALRSIDDCICRDSEEPGGERHTAPLETRKTCKSVVEYFRGQVFSFMAVADAPRNVRVHAFKVILIELGEPGRVLLSGLDRKPLCRFCFLNRQSLFSTA
jgi:hypothetical protein